MSEEDASLQPPPPISPKRRAVALALCVALGLLGAHRYYLGRWKSGLAMTATLGGLTFWTLYDLFLVGAGAATDAEGRPVERWW